MRGIQACNLIVCRIVSCSAPNYLLLVCIRVGSPVPVTKHCMDNLVKASNRSDFYCFFSLPHPQSPQQFVFNTLQHLISFASASSFIASLGVEYRSTEHQMQLFVSDPSLVRPLLFLLSSYSHSASAGRLAGEHVLPCQYH
jgi:hypothetical protein